MSTQLNPLQLSADLLYAVKTEGETDGLREYLASVERERLRRALGERPARLAFWLNCYNAYAQVRLEEEPTALDGGALARWKFFGRDRIPVAGAWLSLDDVEHGMLRSSRHPWGLGYLPRPFPSSFEREFRLETVDPRIHFALSCGAESCPPITVYSPADVDEVLDVATEWYLEENVSYDAEGGVARVPRRFLRYRGDFGGKRGVRAFLRKHGALPEGATPSLESDGSDRSIGAGDYRGQFSRR